MKTKWIDMTEEQKLEDDPITYLVEIILDLKREYGNDDRFEVLKKYIENIIQ